ncbi:substrate-binding periplasmic protein [Pseudoalteromonas aurantia]|uniref:Polar amino acid transport system substrate-binding protein n=1 Tax=Pseudoalteromonas aurantia 208 TaxID=1314867 RepID=A0ABR9E864_9GAMM|nr:transporter substrate-binding domain-containing protein [Pseudoalteromonas aurantia]MBE0367171.1 polar amino acid transport system substrate-binding protein [Pseudoalteromonas aurantia 208]
MRSTLYMFISLLFLGVKHGYAQPLVFVAEDLPPYHFSDKNGNAAGALVDITKAVLHEAQLQGQFEIMPMARAYHELQNNPLALMMSLLKTSSRASQFTWLGQLYFADAYLVSLKGSPHHVSTLNDAQQFRVGTIRGYSSARYLQSAGFVEDKNLLLASHYQQLWHVLFKRRVDFVMTNTLTLEKELKNSGYSALKVEKKLHITHFPSALHLVANKQIPNNICQRLAIALQSIKKKGLYQQILARWKLKAPPKKMTNPPSNTQHLLQPVPI